MRDMADKLKVRLAGSATINTVRAANDANGWPMLFLSQAGNEAEAQPVILIRIMSVDAVSKDIFGNQLTAFNPHTLEIAYELASSGDNAIVAHADLLKAEYECIKTGVRIQLKQLANGTAVTEAAINAAAPSLDIEELYWPAHGV